LKCGKEDEKVKFLGREVVVPVIHSVFERTVAVLIEERSLRL
jgi:hypothetical protein